MKRSQISSTPVLCDECDHREVCKHVDDFLDIVKAVEKAVGKSPRWLSYRLSCADYHHVFTHTVYYDLSKRTMQ